MNPTGHTNPTHFFNANLELMQDLQRDERITILKAIRQRGSGTKDQGPLMLQHTIRGETSY